MPGSAYQAVISYVVYSQVLRGAESMEIADQLRKCMLSRSVDQVR